MRPEPGRERLTPRDARLLASCGPRGLEAGATRLFGLAMKITTGEAVVPLLGAFAPRYVVKQATVKRCVAALLLISVASIFYYTHYIISSPLSR